MSERRGGGVGWALLFAFVAWWDLTRPETLSSAFWRGVLGRWRRPVIAGWLYLTAHLFHLVPAWLDPLRLLARHARR